MKRNLGFTLVELLVVIAIIAILAGIVIPNVPKYINKARATRAYAEVKGIDLALTKMLTDVDRSDFKNGFFVDDTWPAPAGATSQDKVVSAALTYQQVFYVLLRKGKYAPEDASWPVGLVLNADVQRKLGDTYMPLEKDPWGNLYNFYVGPFTAPDAASIADYTDTNGRIIVPFRIYNYTSDVPGGVEPDTLTRTVQDPDSTTISIDVGFPAPRKQTHFVWSAGKNKRSNQQMDPGFNGDPADVGLDFLGGGDDINNWDGDQSWMTHYN